MTSGSEGPPSFLQLDPRRIANRIADTNDYSGGGTAAALTGASAASITTLVLRLSARRKSNQNVADEIDADLQRVIELTETCHHAADSDSETFRQLMNSRRTARDSGDWSGYYRALRDAALSPIALAESLAELLTTVERQVPYASRFTVSDLGAAAALAHGALQAALLTAEVNISMLREAGAEHTLTADELDSRRRHLEESASRLTTTIIRSTRSSLDTEPHNKGQDMRQNET